MTKQMSIYVANLSAYNAGLLYGAWIELPCDKEQLEDEIQEVLKMWSDGVNKSEEFAIHDYELPFKVCEYDNVYKINEYTKTIYDSGIDIDVAGTILEYFNDIEEGLEVIENNMYSVYENCENMTHVAYEVIEESGYLRGVPENIERYFDYEKFGRDLYIEGVFLETENNKYVEIY